MAWRRLKTELLGEARVLADFGIEGDALIQRWYDEGAYRVIVESGIPSGGARYRPEDGARFFHALLDAFPASGMFFVEEHEREPEPLPVITPQQPQRTKRRRTRTGS